MVFYAGPAAHLGSSSTRAGLLTIFRISYIVRFVFGGVVRTFCSASWRLHMEHYKVMLVSDTRSPQIGAACLHDDSDDSLIELSFDGNAFTGTGDDFFDAFCQIREQLAPLGLLPQCYGAHLRAFPSGMSCSMGGGLKLYRLTLGKQALMADLIHMFDTDEDVEPATVADQRVFFDEWIGSLGGS